MVKNPSESEGFFCAFFFGSFYHICITGNINPLRINPEKFSFWYMHWLFGKNKISKHGKEKGYKSEEEWLEDIAHLKWPVIIIFIFIFLLFAYLQFNPQN
jgi:hypothetical protein